MGIPEGNRSEASNNIDGTAGGPVVQGHTLGPVTFNMADSAVAVAAWEHWIRSHQAFAAVWEELYDGLMEAWGEAWETHADHERPFPRLLKLHRELERRCHAIPFSADDMASAEKVLARAHTAIWAVDIYRDDARLAPADRDGKGWEGEAFKRIADAKEAFQKYRRHIAKQDPRGVSG
ncbi:hypothetical protein [Streptomyces anulatus]|uniref:hypothetical protein n=1 Tax=Streptomyces anulatus TaxID=1892 RepID=UPI003321624B